MLAALLVVAAYRTQPSSSGAQKVTRRASAVYEPSPATGAARSARGPGNGSSSATGGTK